MTRLLVRRLAASLLLLYLVLTLTFFVLHLAPGGPVVLFENPRITRQQIERLERIYGLDRPVPERYVRWLGGVARGEWGTSFSHQRPAFEVVIQALPRTFQLALAALVLQYGLGLVLGMVAARRPNRWADHAVRISSLTLYSIPGFWLALMAILLFHLKWNLLPGGGVTSIGAQNLPPMAQLLDCLEHLILPAATLGIAGSGRVARFVRNELLEVFAQDYVTTARAKGLSPARVLGRHALRNALIPVVQLFGLSFPALLNGALVTEVVFAWPGLGRVMFNACLARDYPVVLAGTAVGALLVIAGSLLADVLHGLLDPRVRDA